jgi:hypothetical protein
MPSPGTQSGTTSSGSAGVAAGTALPGRTTEERRATIDRKLDDSLGTLDREIRKEQEKTAQERDARAASNAGAAGTTESTDDEDDGDSKREGDLTSGTADTEGPGAADGEKGNSAEKQKSSRPGDLKSEKEGKSKEGSSGGATSSGSGAAATEIPDGSDDDIVARRLRKAAEQETDPELKEKLWKEYVEYKKGAK